MQTAIQSCQENGSKIEIHCISYELGFLIITYVLSNRKVKTLYVAHKNTSHRSELIESGRLRHISRLREFFFASTSSRPALGYFRFSYAMSTGVSFLGGKAAGA
jgi:hypothetical protein